MRATLEESLRLLGAHLHLFTLVALTVWLPANVALNYLEFFTPAEGGVPRSLRLGLLVQVAFDPLVVSATLMALARIKQGLPLAYWGVMQDGAGAWSRLFFVRLLVTAIVLVPASVGAGVAQGGDRSLAAGALLLVLTVATTATLIRFALVDAVVVLEGRTVVGCWPRAAALTRGRRWTIFGTMVTLFGLLISVAMGAAEVFRAVPEVNHFVVRVLFDCALSVAQSLLTVALFVVYWQAQAAPAATPP